MTKQNEKPFKQWEKRFSKAELIKERESWLPEDIMPGLVKAFEKEWPHTTTQQPQSYVQYCVYDAADAVDWQRFRCCLKGMTTPEKLYCLDAYGKAYFVHNQDWANRKKYKCRIDNYIGALVRGGQLSTDYKVLK